MPVDSFMLVILLDCEYPKIEAQKTKTARVSNRRDGTGTDAVVVSTTLYIYLSACFCLTVYKEWTILCSVPPNTFPALDGMRRGSHCEERCDPPSSTKFHQAKERRSRKRCLLRPWLAGRARARGEAVFRLSIQRIPCRSGSCK